jgi:heme-binding protein
MMSSNRNRPTPVHGLRRVLRPRNVVIGAIGLLLLIQLIPIWLLQTNPTGQAEPLWDSSRTRALAQRSCFDCHSNATVWPLYSRIAPVSWLVTRDVLGGRQALNFSQWRAGSRSGEGGGDVSEVIQSGSMPPTEYLWLHPRAALSDAEKQALIQGLQRSLR